MPLGTTYLPGFNPSWGSAGRRSPAHAVPSRDVTLWRLYRKGRPLGLPGSVGTCRPEKTIAGRRSAGNETANIIAIPALGPPLPFRGEPIHTLLAGHPRAAADAPGHCISTGLQPLPGFRRTTFTCISPTEPRSPMGCDGGALNREYVDFPHRLCPKGT